MLVSMKYSLQRATKDLPKLVKLACAGEEVVIVRGGRPVAKLIPIVPAIKNRVPGSLKGKISWTPDAFDPLTDQELSDLGFE
jgi:antitoxin (DNA-binding transcriptional repressor) of toxin-antitoxin stability system